MASARSIDWRVPAGGNWSEQVLYGFQAGQDGNSSISNLVFDAAGNLYGTTSEGSLGSGTIFELARNGNGTWIENLPHLFAGPPDGAFPYAGMVGDGTGIFTALPSTGAQAAKARFTCSHLTSSEIAQNPVLPAKEVA